MRLGSPWSLTFPARGRALAVVVALFGAAIAACNPEAPRAWQESAYRDFTPETRPPAVGTRSIEGLLTLELTTVQHPRLRPGETANLRAYYRVAASAPLSVKETRVIAYNDTVLTTLTRTVTRASGTVGSECRLPIPSDAAEGWYTLTTLVEEATPTSRASEREQAHTTFYVDGTGTTSAAAASGPGTATDGLTIKLWAEKPRYRVGESLTISFEANRDAYVTLVNVGTSGGTSVLFPNRFSPSNAVQRRRVYTIPDPADGYELKVSGPPGREIVYALVTLEPVRLADPPAPGTRRVFRSLNEEAARFTRDANGLSREGLRDRAKALLEVEVVP
jgi:hypothetical protein